MKATRDSFGEAITKLGEKNPNIVVLDADLSKSTKSEAFGKSFPDRFFQMGIAEMNMIGTAAGLALAGKIPFACSFGCFLTGRYDQIRMSVAYNRANVKLVGTHAGVAIGEDGHSQMGLEDVGLLRALPNFSIFQPADHFEALDTIRVASEIDGPCYIRLTRQKMPILFDENYRFVPGKWNVLHAGADLALIGSGHLVHSFNEANAAMGNKYTLVNAASVKPIDEKLLENLAKTHSVFVTAEDHYVTNGLGSAVAEWIAESGLGIRLFRIGMREFGESGTPEEVYEHFKFNGKGVKSQLEDFLRKIQDR